MMRGTLLKHEFLALSGCTFSLTDEEVILNVQQLAWYVHDVRAFGSVLMTLHRVAV